MNKNSSLLLTVLASLLMLSSSAQSWTNGGNTLTANGTLGTNSNHSLILETANTARGIVTNSGRWHIGSTGTPTAKLQLTYNSAVGDPHLLLYEPANDFARLYFKNSNTASYFAISGFPASTTLKEMVDKLINSQSGTITNLSAAYLEVNTPNPFKGTTVIRYQIPEGRDYAQLLITDVKGAVVKTIPLSKGSRQVSINSHALAAGTYTYSLWIDKKQVDSKKMVITR